MIKLSLQMTVQPCQKIAAKKRQKGVRQKRSFVLEWNFAGISGRRDVVQVKYRLGEMYEQGLGFSQDKAKALKWYRRAVDQGDINVRKTVVELE
jgi:TPR repeat protein